MNTQRAITVIGVTFLFWISARGRYPQYAALVHSEGAASSPASAGGGSGSVSNPIGAAAAITKDVVSKVWNTVKAQ